MYRFSLIFESRAFLWNFRRWNDLKQKAIIINLYVKKILEHSPDLKNKFHIFTIIEIAALIAQKSNFNFERSS